MFSSKLLNEVKPKSCSTKFVFKISIFQNPVFFIVEFFIFFCNPKLTSKTIKGTSSQYVQKLISSRVYLKPLQNPGTIQQNRLKILFIFSRVPKKLSQKSAKEIECTYFHWGATITSAPSSHFDVRYRVTCNEINRVYYNAQNKKVRVKGNLNVISIPVLLSRNHNYFYSLRFKDIYKMSNSGATSSRKWIPKEKATLYIVFFFETLPHIILILFQKLVYNI